MAMENNNDISLPKKTSFIRIMDLDGVKELQLAKRTYKDKMERIRLTLLSATHFAQAKFYERHNQILSEAQIVFYEGKGLDAEGMKW